MLVRDAIYGAFELPAYIQGLIEAPEFRRLTGVRMLNINSPSLAALADVTRYSHTLGVLRLALANPLIGLSESEIKAFFASIIVHDAGSPAFAHLLEYFLKEMYGWDHESVVQEMLTESRVVVFKKMCRAAGVDFNLVLEFVSRKHHFSRLIFGSLDFDNIDNVARMNAMLGESVNRVGLLRLASQIGVDALGNLQLPETLRPEVEYWLRLRENAYNILVFDPPTVSGQAVLSSLMATALDIGLIDQNDWRYGDRELLDVFRRDRTLKRVLKADFEGRLPGCCLIHQAKSHLEKFDKLGRATLVSYIVEYMKRTFGSDITGYGYVFRDKGAFSKRVEFFDPGARTTWSAGARSDSYVFYGFLRGHPSTDGAATRTGRDFSEWLLTRI